VDDLARCEQALVDILSVWSHHAPYWRDEVSDEMADIARSALNPTPSLANAPMEPEKRVGEGHTPKPDGSCDQWNYGMSCDEWECAPVGIRDRRVIWDWVRNS
jgi:hypothetical protein